MKTIKFRMVAYTGAAGKFDTSAPMNGNEDNFYVDDNLSDDIPNHCDQDAILNLSECGLIMAVADGMGGMNAGEVASEIAVNTVRDFFAPGKISVEMASSSAMRKRYMEELVVEADRRIKEDARVHREHEGMGSTIILAWIVGNQLTITWCGDSRAYRYNPKMGIELLSEDHSYVQELVKRGVLTYDDTFEHPQGNIVTRSLGERGKVSQPETRQFEIYNSDVILLCSDGLSGVLRDKKTKDIDGNYYSGDNIEDIIRNNSSTMKACKDALWEAAEHANWYDNVTILLCQIVDGANQMSSIEVTPKKKGVSQQVKQSKNFWTKTLHVRIKPKSFVLALCGFLLLCVGIGIALRTVRSNNELQNEDGTMEMNNEEQGLVGGDTRDLELRKAEMIRHIQERCTDFMKLSNKKSLEEVSGYQSLGEKIDNSTDTTTLYALRDEIKAFVEQIKIKTSQISEIDRKLGNSNDTINKRLAKLRQKCIDEFVGEDIFKKEMHEIQKLAPNVKSSEQTKSDKKNEEVQEGQEPQQVGTEEPELTQVNEGEDYIFESYINPIGYSNDQLTEFKNKYLNDKENEGLEFKGFFEPDKKRKETKWESIPGRKYIVRFKK